MPSWPVLLTVTCAPGHRHAVNPGNESGGLRRGRSDANDAGFARHAQVSNIDIVTARREIHAGLKAHRNVVTSGAQI